MEKVYNIEILRMLSFNEEQIKEILKENKHYIKRDKKDVIELLKSLSTIGIKDIKDLLERNPFILNKDSFEIYNFVENEKKKGKTIKDILELIEIDPYCID